MQAEVIRFAKCGKFKEPNFLPSFFVGKSSPVSGGKNPQWVGDQNKLNITF